MIRDWTDSLRMDGLSAEAERLFMRLIMKADDYGRFHGDARLIKAACFPLSDEITKGHITEWMKPLTAKGLIVEYQAEHRQVIAIANYGQRLKMSKAKFPQLPGKPDDWLPAFSSFLPLPGTSGNFPPEGKGTRREPEAETETEQERPPAPKGEFPFVQEILPQGWNRLTKTEQGRIKVNRNTEQMVRIGKWFGQKETTLWTVSEYIALTQVDPSPEDMDLIGEHYSYEIPENGYRMTTISTLLNNWSKARAKAVRYFEENPELRSA